MSESGFPAFEAGFWAGRGDHRNVLEAWHAHTGQEPPTIEQYRAHYLTPRTPPEQQPSDRRRT